MELLLPAMGRTRDKARFEKDRGSSFEHVNLALVVKTPHATIGDARDVGLILGSGRYPGGGNGNPVQSSCLENSMDRGAWWATVHGVTKSQIRLSIHVFQRVTVTVSRHQPPGPLSPILLLRIQDRH